MVVFYLQKYFDVLILQLMKVFYVTNARIPTEKAHGYQIAKMCEEFARAGIEVELVVPRRDNYIKEDVFSFYNIKKNFKIKYINSFDFLKYVKILKSFAFYLQSIFFLIRLFFLKINKNVVYTRNPEIAWLFALKGNKVFFEAHYWPASKHWLYKFFLKGATGIICNSKGTSSEYKRNGFRKLFVAPNGVDLAYFDNIKNSKQELRRELNLPINKKIVMYIGSLYKWKGIEIIIKTAQELKKEREIFFVIVGGNESEIGEYKKIVDNCALSNVLFCGRKEKIEIPKYLKSADVLLLPNIPCSEESIKYTSPIKMFEYMASKRPIIASRLPSIEEILDSTNAFLVKAGDYKDLADMIKKIAENIDANEVKEKVNKAFNDVKEFTWSARAKKILSFINSNL